MDKLIKALLLGIAAGIIDVIPLVFQGQNWQVSIATLLRWVAMGIIITYARMPLNGWASGLVIALFTGVPFAILASETAPSAVVPLLSSSVLLGGLLGLAADKLITNQPGR
jgi:hypothetical protein